VNHRYTTARDRPVRSVSSPNNATAGGVCTSVSRCRSSPGRGCPRGGRAPA
jgi:hypothetical protein